jgi:hypothetical protein
MARTPSNGNRCAPHGHSAQPLGCRGWAMPLLSTPVVCSAQNQQSVSVGVVSIVCQTVCRSDAERDAFYWIHIGISRLTAGVYAPDHAHKRSGTARTGVARASASRGATSGRLPVNVHAAVAPWIRVAAMVSLWITQQVRHNRQREPANVR